MMLALFALKPPNVMSDETADDDGAQVADHLLIAGFTWYRRVSNFTATG
jgi:hypothetical protein